MRKTFDRKLENNIMKNNSIINFSEYKENRASERLHVDCRIEDIDLDAAFSKAFGFDSPENRLQEKYNENELHKLRKYASSVHIPTETELNRILY